MRKEAVPTAPPPLFLVSNIFSHGAVQDPAKHINGVQTDAPVPLQPRDLRRADVESRVRI